MKILITGGTGMLGSAFSSIKTDYELVLVGSADYDLRWGSDCRCMIADHQPGAIIHLAAKVGGVKGNTDYVSDFFRENILINTNLLDAAKNQNIKKVVSLLSTCVYPDSASYPLTPEQIHSGPPHYSNFGYAYSKRMLDIHSRAIRKQHGLNYITAIPNNLFGINDNFDSTNGHVIPSIMRKILEGKLTNKEVVLWHPDTEREFTFANDIADILLFLLEEYNSELPINIGQTKEYKISDVTKFICKSLDYDYNKILWDTSMPKGQQRKPSCNKKFRSLYPGFEYTDLNTGIDKTCKWLIENYPNVRGV